jgi:hypothetical protein
MEWTNLDSIQLALDSNAAIMTPLYPILMEWTSLDSTQLALDSNAAIMTPLYPTLSSILSIISLIAAFDKYSLYDVDYDFVIKHIE